MALVYEAGARISAPADRVWAILTDGPGYTTWDNGVVRVDGSITDGERIKVYAEIDPKRAFPVTVGDWDPPRGMSWTGGMPLGLFKGQRRFTLTPDGPATGFHMREVFSGLMSPLIIRSMPDLQPSFDEFVAGLKAAAEA